MQTFVLPKTHQDKKDMLWLNLIAMDLDSQKAYARGGNPIKTGARLGEWKILAPKDIQESISHDWGEYESLATRVAQKAGNLKKATVEGKSIWNATKTAIIEGKNQQSKGNFLPEQLINQTASALASVEATKYKIDSAMVYQNSKKREYSLSFVLAQFPSNNKSDSSSNYDSIFYPIRELQKLSCAQLGSGLISLSFPAIFKIYTTPSKIININHAALISVQPTWRAPFKDGYPTVCELQLTFIDIEPLYRKSFEFGGIVKTHENPLIENNWKL